MKDTYSDIGPVATLVPATQSATLKGSAVDLQGFNSATMIVSTGAIVSAGLYVMSLQESDTTTDGDFTDVAAGDMLGSLPASLAASTVYKVGYKGAKRYIRAVITKTSGTSIDAGAVIVRGHPYDAPVA
jgi:hypothetical protein